MPDTWLAYGGRVAGAGRGSPWSQALLVHSGRVVTTGPRERLLRLAPPGTTQIDLGGATVLPALTDSHCHLLGAALAAEGLDLSDALDKHAILALVAGEAHRLEHLGATADWVVGRGWDESSMRDATLPTRTELLRASAGHPVLLWRTCGHVALVAGLAGDDEAGRQSSVVATHPETDALVAEAAAARTAALQPTPPVARVQAALRSMIRQAWSRGLVAAHANDVESAAEFNAVMQVYREVLADSPFRVMLDWAESASPQVEEYVRPIPATLPLPTGLFLFQEELPRTRSWLMLGGAKFYVDGSLGARTAALNEPYADRPGWRGVLRYEPTALQERVGELAGKGAQIVMHAIGDAALDAALDALTSLRHPNGTSSRLPHRIVHAQLLPPEAPQRMATLGVMADIQPQFLLTDSRFAVAALGSRRLSHSYAWRTLARAGVRLAGGSDAPVERLDPLAGIEAAQGRGFQSQPGWDWTATEALSADEALQLYTEAPAWEEGCSDRGSFSAGALADVVVVSMDEQNEPAVRCTLIGGSPVYGNDWWRGRIVGPGAS